MLLCSYVTILLYSAGACCEREHPQHVYIRISVYMHTCIHVCTYVSMCTNTNICGVLELQERSAALSLLFCVLFFLLCFCCWLIGGHLGHPSTRACFSPSPAVPPFPSERVATMGGRRPFVAVGCAVVVPLESPRFSFWF